MTGAIIVSILAMAVRMSVPYWFGSLGEMYSQKSGVLNIGLEGVMTAGAFVSFYVAYHTSNCWIGLLVAILVCMGIGLIYGGLVIFLGVDQPITGIAFNLLILGVTNFLYRQAFSTTSSPSSPSSFHKISIPILSKIPVLGEVLFNQYFFFYLGIVVLIFSVWFFKRFKQGVIIIGCGENPGAAETRGVNVNRVRLMCTLVSAGFAGVAGTWLSLGQLSSYTVDMVSGRGFIAFALVIFGKWEPKRICIGALFFGLLEAIALTLQASSAAIPYQFLLMLPYVFTVVALLITTFNERSARPSCLGVRYKASV